MARKKTKSTGLATAAPAKQKVVTPAAASRPAAPAGAGPSLSRFTVLGMASSGALLGFLSGLNQWPATPAEIVSPVSDAAWLGGTLGMHLLNYAAASQGAFLGLVVGLGFALSFAFRERKMLSTWTVALSGLFLGTMVLKTMTAAAGGWLLGLMLAMSLPDRG